MLLKILKSVVQITSRRYATQFSSSAKNKGENLAAVLYGINDMRIEPRPCPCPGENQVLLQMESIGICGSDVHFYVEGKIGPFVVTKPMVIGHEASGMVVETGAKVKHLKPGDTVAIEPQTTCRMCSFCKEGRYNLCPDVLFCATPPGDGNLQRIYAHDADFCFKIPDHMSFDEGALIEPLTVGVHACKRAKIRFGDSVLITGAGPIGITTMLAAKAMGASVVLITDTLDSRLKTVKEFGADCVYLTKVDAPDEQVVKDIKEMLGDNPRVTIECSGAEQCVRVGLKATKTGGVLVLTGLGKPEMMLPVFQISLREVDVRGVWRYNNDYPSAIEMVATGKANVKPLVTHHFKIEDSVKAFETAKNRIGNPIKIMIHPNPNWSPPNNC